MFHQGIQTREKGIVHCKTEIVRRVEFITDLDHLNMSEEGVIRMNL